MGLNLDDIHSLTDFQRNAKEHLKRLRRSGRPTVLTVNGKAECVVQDAKSYQKLLDLVDRAEAIEGIRRGLADVEAGRTQPADKAFDALRKKLGIPKEV